MKNALLLFIITSAISLGADPIVGIWKPTQLEKWKGYQEDRKSHLLIVEPAGKDRYRITVTTLDGKTVVTPASVEVYDGEESNGDRPNVKKKMERIDERHLRETYTGPKGVTIEDIITSADGTTETITDTGRGTTTGRIVDNCAIYERQPGK
jgi:hypothetical protein